ncbi:hypothetical protein JCM10207_008544 [Rhodosporidiobolus poonsookiae]
MSTTYLSRRRPLTPLPLPTSTRRPYTARKEETADDTDALASPSGSSSESAAEEGLLTPETAHLSTRTRTILIAVFVILVIAAAGWAYYKWGSDAVAAWEDFVTFPPVDITGAVVSVWNEVTSGAMSVFSEATAHVVGAESTATSAVVSVFTQATEAVVGAENTATSALAQVTNVAKVTELGNIVGGLFG